MEIKLRPSKSSLGDLILFDKQKGKVKVVIDCRTLICTFKPNNVPSYAQTKSLIRSAMQTIIPDLI